MECLDCTLNWMCGMSWLTHDRSPCPAEHRDLAWGSPRAQDTAISYPVNGIRLRAASGLGPDAFVWSPEANVVGKEPEIRELLPDCRFSASWTCGWDGRSSCMPVFWSSWGSGGSDRWGAGSFTAQLQVPGALRSPAAVPWTRGLSAQEALKSAPEATLGAHFQLLVHYDPLSPYQNPVSQDTVSHPVGRACSLGSLFPTKHKSISISYQPRSILENDTWLALQYIQDILIKILPLCLQMFWGFPYGK